MTDELIDLDRIGLSLVPGPWVGPDVRSSLDLYDDCLEVACAPAVAALLELPGVVITSGDAPLHSPDWRAQLLSDHSAIEFQLGYRGDAEDTQTWWGFGLDGLATASDVDRIALHLAQRLGPVWVHDGDCVMYRAGAFAGERRITPHCS